MEADGARSPTTASTQPTVAAAKNPTKLQVNSRAEEEAWMCGGALLPGGGRTGGVHLLRSPDGAALACRAGLALVPQRTRAARSVGGAHPNKPARPQ